MITGYWRTFPGIKLRAVQCVLRWWIGDLRPLFVDFKKELVHHSATNDYIFRPYPTFSEAVKSR
jgi:hypothetical protein